METLGLTNPVAVVAMIAMLGGIRIRKRFHALPYRRWMIKVLWISTALFKESPALAHMPAVTHDDRLTRERVTGKRR